MNECIPTTLPIPVSSPKVTIYSSIVPILVVTRCILYILSKRSNTTYFTMNICIISFKNPAKFITIVIYILLVLLV